MNPHGQPRIEWREIVESYECPDCGAGPGDRCVSSTGHAKWEPHAARSRLASSHGWHYPEQAEP